MDNIEEKLLITELLTKFERMVTAQEKLADTLELMMINKSQEEIT